MFRVGIQWTCLFLILLGLPAASVWANSFSAVQPGTTRSFPIANEYSLNAAFANPAGVSLLLDEDSKDGAWRTGILSNISLGVEYGDVENFEEELSDLLDQLELDNLSLSQASVIINDFDDVLTRLGEAGYITLAGAAKAPAFPVAWRSPWLGGDFGVDLEVQGTGRGSILDEPLRFNPLSSQLETRSALYIKAAGLIRLGLSYSRPLFRTPLGTLYAGPRLNLYQATLAKTLTGLQTIAEEEEDEDIVVDRIQEDFDDQRETTTGVGLDVGLIWRASVYQLGLTLEDINEPSFNYGALGADCDELTGSRRSDCLLAQSFADRIDLNETHTMELRATLTGMIYTPNRNWLLGGRLETDSSSDPIGGQYQWASVSAAHYGGLRWVPDVRLAYRQNLTGTELSYLDLGVTLLSRLNLDVSYALDSTEVDGTNVPRGLGMSLGLETRY
jgi:hypothetical protein